MEMENVYTAEEAADFLRVTVHTIYHYIKGGKLNAAKLGNEYRIKQSDIEALFNEREPDIFDYNSIHIPHGRFMAYLVSQYWDDFNKIKDEISKFSCPNIDDEQITHVFNAVKSSTPKNIQDAYASKSGLKLVINSLNFTEYLNRIDLLPTWNEFYQIPRILISDEKIRFITEVSISAGVPLGRIQETLKELFRIDIGYGYIGLFGDIFYRVYHIPDNKFSNIVTAYPEYQRDIRLKTRMPSAYAQSVVYSYMLGNYDINQRDMWQNVLGTSFSKLIESVSKGDANSAKRWTEIIDTAKENIDKMGGNSAKNTMPLATPTGEVENIHVSELIENETIDRDNPDASLQSKDNQAGQQIA